MPDLSSLRLVEVPHAAPPYDCECSEGAGAEVAAVGPVPVPAVPVPAVPVPAAGAEAAGVRPGQLAVVIVEVLAGVRPGRQLVPLASERVRSRVASLAPLLASGRRPRIARIMTSRPADRVVEMTVVVAFDARSRALAMRFEQVAARPAAPGWPARAGHWRCTALEAG